MAEEQTRWTHDDVKTLLERGTIADLEKLIAHPGSQYRQEKANSYAVNALKLLAESDVLPDDIRSLVQRMFTLMRARATCHSGTLPVTRDSS